MELHGNVGRAPWASDLFGDEKWCFQQDSAPVHKANETQDWLSEQPKPKPKKDIKLIFFQPRGIVHKCQKCMIMNILM